DILKHFQREFPSLEDFKAKWIVINNGIYTARFLKNLANAGDKLRNTLNISKEYFIFGSFGRFMPEKGFNYIIEATDILRRKENPSLNFFILAVGSGDYEREYKRDVEGKDLLHLFRFMPFSPNVADLMKGCDTILMPCIVST
ncbi:unnamed protein product, partial [marine sediment metagenome]